MTKSLPQAAVSFSLKLFTCCLLLLSISSSYTNAHNITQILAAHPSLSTFNHYLTVTRLDTEINRRSTITVLVVENSAMSLLLSKQLSLHTIKNILSLHILVEYFGAKKLKSIPDRSTSTASLYQASGSAPGTSGFVNITNLKGGKVGFGTDNGKLQAFFVKPVYESPSNISVQQISQLLQSNQAEAPSSAPSVNVTASMSKECKAFADLLIATEAETIFNDFVIGGLTVFCPTNAAVDGFMPKYNNLTEANKETLLLFHCLPVFQSPQMLKSNNGMVNTLATVGNSKYQLKVQNDKEVIKLVTKVATSTITGAIVAEGPLAIYTIDKFLEPEEIFTSIIASSPAPNDGEAESPEGEPSDEGSRGFRSGVVRPLILVLSFCLCILFV